MNHIGDKLAAYLAGELDPTLQAELAAHLDRCPDCAREVTEARALWQRLDVAGPAGDGATGSVWPAVRSRTVARTAAVAAGRRNPWSRFAVPAVAMAAGLALAVLLPVGRPADVAAETPPGGSFWFGEQSDTALSEMWLAASDEESGA